MEGDTEQSPRDAEQNAALFRAANEQIEQRRTELSHPGDAPYLCECEDRTCTQTIRLSPDEYARVRQSPQAFLIAPGHSTSAARVVEHNDRYWIAVKEGEAGDPTKLATENA